VWGIPRRKASSKRQKMFNVVLTITEFHELCEFFLFREIRVIRGCENVLLNEQRHVSAGGVFEERGGPADFSALNEV